MINREIYVTFTKRGIHKYPEAATAEYLKDVKYLGSEHHHFFEFKVSITVDHNNRQIEFHQFLNWIESLYESKVLALDYKSCEMMAEDLIEKINQRYPNRKIKVDVSEDGYVGAVLEFFGEKND